MWRINNIGRITASLIFVAYLQPVINKLVLISQKVENIDDIYF